MTTNQAKKIIRDFLVSRGLKFSKLTAKTVGFSDLARGDCIFVRVHGFKPNPLWEEIRSLARSNGFRAEAY